MNKLISNHKRSFGRSFGKISVRHIFSGHKKKFRIIDFNRRIKSVVAIVKKFQYDPFRNSEIALISFLDGDKKYILRNSLMKIGDAISFNEFKIKNIDGNSTLIKNISIGTFISCVENIPKNGACFARSAGSFCELISKDNELATIKLSSGFIKKISVNCTATIGKIFSKEKKKKYKAGQKIWLGIKPTVRGVAMNPVDHPHGGGEGKTSGGRHPSTPWGKKTKGKKTRKNVKIN